MGKASRRKTGAAASKLVSRAADTIKRLGGSDNIKIRNRAPSVGKISGALVQLLDGEVPPESDLEEYQACLDFTVIAWNMSILDDAQRKAALDDFGQSIKAKDDQTSAAVLRFVEWQMQRKLALFPDDKRTILSWEVRFKGGGVAVSAVAASPDVDTDH